MRLTLRTLLAYLDDAIDPKDAQGLSRKIEESEFASGLMQRLRGVTHKPRLPAPKVDGKGLGLDANTVAEYIESTLPAERVAEFERLCIESDMHLAEVAATHQILTLVLGRPADVSHSLRQRIYRIDTAEVGKPRAETVSDTKEVATKAPERKRWVDDAPHATPREVALASANTVAEDELAHAVPEYLKSGRETASRWPWILAIAAGFLMTAVVLRAMGPFDGNHPLARLLGAAPPPAVDHGIPALPQIQTPPITTEPKLVPPTPKPVDELAAATVEPVPAKPVVPMPEPQPEPQPEPAKPEPAKPEPTEPSIPADPQPEVPPVVAPPLNPKPRPNVAVDVGRFLSEEQILTRFDEKSGLWTRLAPKALLPTNERLVSLPVFRPLIALPSGVQMNLLGETHFRLLPPGESGAPRIQLDQGRISLVTDGVAGGKVDLVLAGLEVSLALVDADSVVALDVRPFLPPGSDPQQDEAVRVIEVFAANGQITLEQEGQKPLEVRTNFVATFLNNDPADVSGPFRAPEWLDIRSTKDVDRDAARYIEKAVSLTKPLPIHLAELLEDRRVEVRSLAARSLAVLGECDGLLSALSDSRQATFWNAEIDTLRGIIARNPESAGNVKHAITRIFGDRGEMLNRILWGYSAEQLSGGAALELVKGLESPDLEVRVLAVNTLERITGANFAYRAAARPETNKPAIQRFRERAQDGQLTYKQPPTPTTEFKALEGK